MRWRTLRTLFFSSGWRVTALGMAGASALIACTAAAPAAKKKTPFDPGDGDFYGGDVLPTEEEPLPATINPDSGAFAPERPAPPTKPRRPDGGSDYDAGPKVWCPPIAAGDLAVVEVMIASKTGTNDSGEWVEVRNMRECWLALKGVSVESPRGSAAANVATITEDLELAPHATFVVADSADPTKNGGIPGTVFAWTATDVLKNDTDSVIVKKGSLQIDKLTYPALSISAGRSVAFPDDCPGADRSDWNRWSLSFDEYAPALKGTPNAPNLDIVCF